MNFFFLIVEPLIFLGGGYLLFYKKDLAIIYLPALFFASAVTVSPLPAFVGYGFFSAFIGVLIYYNPLFFKRNVFAGLLFFLHIALIPDSSDLVFIRPTLFSVLWMLLLVPLSMTILEKYSRKVIFRELSKSSFIILSFFLVNVLFSTFFNYSPYGMYGMQSGILYGELVDTDFNILAVAVFIVFLFLRYTMDPWYLLVSLMSLALIGLSMRRSVMGACILGLAFILLILLAKGETQKVLKVLSIILFAGLIVTLLTDFVSLFQERFEQRNLSERELAGEIRFAEYALLYKDAFLHYDFNPWTGYELLNSRGNYGKGVFGNRSLHGDITNMIHSTGLVGLTLYLLMVIRTLWNTIKHVQTRTDTLITLYCVLIFIIFTITGRYSQTGYMTLLFLLLCIPLGRVEREGPRSARSESSSVSAIR